MTATAEIVPASAPAAQGAPAEPRPPRVLMLTHRLPYPPDRGDRIRSYHLLKHLAQRFDVAVACVSDEPVWLQHHELLRTMASQVVLQPISTRWSALRGAAALVAGRPITPAWHYRVGLTQEILHWHEQKPFDLVLTFCTGMVHYARVLGQAPRARPPLAGAGPRVRHVLDLVDVDSMKWDSYARAAWPPLSWVYALEARRLRAIEAGRRERFDAITVVSDNEARAYRATVGDHAGLTVVRNGVDLDYFQPRDDPGGHRLVFVGVLNYRPNAEGITWFAREVMPRLRQRVPDARLTIVGRHPTAPILALQQIPGVDVAGSVPDVRDYLGQASLVVAPLLIARGVQNKVLEAMACGRCAVVSEGAAQGIDATPDEHFLVARDAAHWVEQIARAWGDDGLRRRLAAAGRARVEQTYSWASAVRPMIDLIERLTQPA